jgi:PBP1b-binding outer membrane lipoprotein LpoB
MRKFFVVAVILAALLVSCSSESPSSVTRKFYAAMESNDAAAIQKYATPEAAGMINAMLSEEKVEMLKVNGKITDAVETIDGDTAEVTLTFESGETQSWDLVKVDGKWKVTINK